MHIKKIARIASVMLLIMANIAAPHAASAYTHAFTYGFGNSWSIDGHSGLERISYSYPDGWLSIRATYARSSCCWASYPPVISVYNEALAKTAGVFNFGLETATHKLFGYGGITDWYTIEFAFSPSGITETVWREDDETTKETVVLAADQDFGPGWMAHMFSYIHLDGQEHYDASSWFMDLEPVPITNISSMRCSTICCR